MSLFEVPGWTVPAAPSQSKTSNKRKRQSHPAVATDKLESAANNIEALMQTLDAGHSAQERRGKKRKLDGGSGKKRGVQLKQEGAHDELAHGKKTKKNKKNRSSPGDDASPSHSAESKIEIASLKSKEKDKAAKKVEKHQELNPGNEGEKSPKPPPAKKPPGLTDLQARMRQSLDGARFRLINETLYKSDSGHAYQMVKDDPNVFEEYHQGFRHQVQSWPANPVSHYIDILSSYPPKTVIADLGCGDAALAKALVPRGLTVLSFDLVSDGKYIVEADTCTKIPLPGSEENVDDGQLQGEGQVVDVVVCALSLMGTNWPGCIREAWRILKIDGELKIAEVASRFTDIEAFVSLITSTGFKLKSKDDRNTHFTLFEFRKVAISEKEWEKVMSKGSLLKPCEYKRR